MIYKITSKTATYFVSDAPFTISSYDGEQAIFASGEQAVEMDNTLATVISGLSLESKRVGFLVRMSGLFAEPRVVRCLKVNPRSVDILDASKNSFTDVLAVQFGTAKALLEP